jgi:hypothetical protein
LGEKYELTPRTPQPPATAVAMLVFLVSRLSVRPSRLLSLIGAAVPATELDRSAARVGLIGRRNLAGLLLAPETIGDIK